MSHEISEIKRNSDQELEWVLSMRILAKNMLRFHYCSENLYKTKFKDD